MSDTERVECVQPLRGGGRGGRGGGGAAGGGTGQRGLTEGLAELRGEESADGCEQDFEVR